MHRRSRLCGHAYCPGAVLAEERGWRELPVPAIGQDGVQALGPDLTARLGDLTNLLAISSG